MAPKLRECDIQKQITDWLSLHRIFWFRSNTGATRGIYKGKSRFVRFGKRGSPDLVCIIDGKYVGLEVKIPGRSLSVAQHQFGIDVIAAGGFYFQVESLEEAMGAINRVRLTAETPRR